MDFNSETLGALAIELGLAHVRRVGDRRVCVQSVPLGCSSVCEGLDVDVDLHPYHSSEWLRANVLLDVLPAGTKCFGDRERRAIRMADMPRLVK